VVPPGHAVKARACLEEMAAPPRRWPLANPALSTSQAAGTLVPAGAGNVGAPGATPSGGPIGPRRGRGW